MLEEFLSHLAAIVDGPFCKRNYQAGPSKLVRFVKISSISLCFPMWAVLSEEESARRSGARVPTSRFAGRHRRLPSPPPIPRQLTEKPRKGPGQQRWGGYLPVLGFDVRTCPYHQKTLDSAWSFVPLDRTLVHVGPAKLESLRPKRFFFLSFVRSKSPYSLTGPKKTLKCVQTFSHYFYFFNLYASRNAVYILSFAELLTQRNVPSNLPFKCFDM